MIPIEANRPQMHLTFACGEGGGGGGQDDLVKAKAAQRRGGAQLVNTLADASPPLTHYCAVVQTNVEKSGNVS